MAAADPIVLPANRGNAKERLLESIRTGADHGLSEEELMELAADAEFISDVKSLAQAAAQLRFMTEGYAALFEIIKDSKVKAKDRMEAFMTLSMELGFHTPPKKETPRIGRPPKEAGTGGRYEEFVRARSDGTLSEDPA